MQSIKNALNGLSDIDGVLGSFVLGDSGALLGSNLPAVFDEQVFAEAGPRLTRLVEASAALAEGLRSCVLRFSEHKLFVRPVDGALLGVVLSAGASLPALKVATNIVSRRLASALSEPRASDPELAGPTTSRSPVLPTPPTPAPPSVHPAPAPVTTAQPAPAVLTPAGERRDGGDIAAAAVLPGRPIG